MAIDAKTTLARLTACLPLLVGAAVAHAADPALEISEQPDGVKRAEIVHIVWAGEPAQVVVEHRHGLSWVARASTAGDDVRLQETDEGTWSARWQPTYDSASGTYRIRVEGDGSSVTSDDFRVRPCRCVIPNRLRSKWRDGRFRLAMTADYAPGPPGGYQALPSEVTTGRPLVRVMRDGRRIGSVRLRYRRGKFRGGWAGPREPQGAVVFQLVALSDGFGNRF